MALVATIGLGAIGGPVSAVAGASDTVAASIGVVIRACRVTATASGLVGYERPDGPRAAAVMAARRPRPVAVFLGDSYTSGWHGIGEDSAGWPSILGVVRHWSVHDLAVAGTGFVNPGWTDQPIGSEVGAAIALRPGIVFVAGGHNDEDLASGPVALAADRVLDRLAAGLPDAVLVVIGPIWPDGRPKATIVRLRDHLRSRAAGLGALFIDPIAAGWFAGANERFIGPDGTHPTASGYRRIATLVGAALETDPRLSFSLARDKVAAIAVSPKARSEVGTMAAAPGSGACPS